MEKYRGPTSNGLPEFYSLLNLPESFQTFEIYNWETSDGKNIFDWVVQQKEPPIILLEPITSSYFLIHFTNSQKLPDSFFERLINNPQVIRLSEKVGCTPEELVYFAGRESSQQMLSLAFYHDYSLSPKIVGIYGLILVDYKDIRLVYRNASVSDPLHKGLYSHHVLSTASSFPINIFAASTNHPSLPDKWAKMAEDGFGRGTPWEVFPRVNEDDEIITLPPLLQLAIEDMRKIPNLNLISGTPPDYEHTQGTIRRSQEGGVKREKNLSQSPLYQKLSKRFGFNPEKGDQILFLAIDPTLLSKFS